MACFVVRHSGWHAQNAAPLHCLPDGGICEHSLPLHQHRQGLQCHRLAAADPDRGYDCVRHGHGELRRRRFPGTGHCGPDGPMGKMRCLAGFVVLTVLLTQPMSNAAAALVIVPVALRAAAEMSADPRAFAIAIMLAASVSLVTPFEPACILVYTPGKYRFLDFIKLALRLHCCCWWLLFCSCLTSGRCNCTATDDTV